MTAKHIIDYQKLDKAQSILQGNNWMTSIIYTTSNFPIIKAEHANGKKILLLFLETEKEIKNLGKNIIEEFNSINSGLKGYIKYFSFFKANVVNGAELILKEIGK